ncbi:MAG TPA: HAD-IIA family hydrolase [Thermomicrobiales bacterium]|nr:HAD-IIA family hydrolase [Thermomicrobiales bacterium]
MTTTVQTRNDPGMLARLRAASTFIFDMDGVLYRGSEALPGVRSLLETLGRTGKRFMLATNNSMASPESYTAKLANMGIQVSPERILTSGTATGDYLRETLPPGAGLYIVGMPALSEQILGRTDFHPVDAANEVPAAVVVGLDLTFTYEKMKLAMASILAGATFVATNADATLPTERGFVPGAGSIIAGIALASGVQPTVIGKPSPRTLLHAAKQMGASPAETVMIGDRLDTDILAGQRADMLTVLVLTGVSSRDDVEREGIVPDLIFDNALALHHAIDAPLNGENP